MTTRVLRLQEVAVEGRDIVLHGLYIAERIDTRSLDAPRLASAPLVVEAGADGLCVIFRYGVLVFVQVSPEERVRFQQEVDLLLQGRFDEPVTDGILMRVRSDDPDRVEGGVVICGAIDLERIQVVAEGLAKSIALTHYEGTVAAAFDEVEPVAEHLEKKGRAPRSARKLAKRIGGVLSALTRTVGRLEVTEKPEVLWDHSRLDPLYARVEDELELVARQRALERKLAVAEQATRVVLELRQHTQSLRVEWYIVVLILAEIAISLYQLSR
jgi:uncharacterized Rmd1/YagE family protein